MLGKAEAKDAAKDFSSLSREAKGLVRLEAQLTGQLVTKIDVRVGNDRASLAVTPRRLSRSMEHETGLEPATTTLATPSEDTEEL